MEEVDSNREVGSCGWSVVHSFAALDASLISFNPSLNAGAAVVRSLYVPWSFRFLFLFSSSLNLFHSADSGALYPNEIYKEFCTLILFYVSMF